MIKEGKQACKQERKVWESWLQQADFVEFQFLFRGIVHAGFGLCNILLYRCFAAVTGTGGYAVYGQQNV